MDNTYIFNVCFLFAKLIYFKIIIYEIYGNIVLLKEMISQLYLFVEQKSNSTKVISKCL